ncbi:MAG: hypothetical protein ACOX22_12605 [Caldicoprobacterales bacterium]|jgi:hypothetical protein|nr:hypothetical protein [Clostridiales bacterium]
MQYYLEILHINDDHVVVILDGVTCKLPISVFPDHSKVGDILQLQLSFCPFKTLTQTK